MLDVLEEARRLGFLGPGPVADHVAHARAYHLAMGMGDGDDGMGDGVMRALDLGSGGGVPGLVLALDLPEWQWGLLDANHRRAAFLASAAVRLELQDRVRVIDDRAEVAGRQPDHRHQYRAVVARSFAPPAVVAECAAPFLRVGGRLVVSEPPEGEPRWPVAALEELGLRFRGVGPAWPRLASLEQAAPCPDRFPRRVGVPAKRPLW